MWNALKLVTPPVGSILSLDDVKAHCRVTSSDDDTYLSGLIAAATAYLEGPFGIGVALLTQTWRLSLDCFPCGGVIRIPLGPVQSVSSVTWIDYSSQSHTLDPSAYTVDLDHDPARIARAYAVSWPSTVLPSPGAVKITFVTGYGADASSVPADLKHAALLLIGSWFENREATVGLEKSATPSELPLGVSAILDKYRVSGF